MEADLEAQATWLAHTLEEGLRLGVLAPAELLMHVTPEVLAERLPRDLMVKVFASAFSTGKLTPEGLLAVAPPSTLARHVAPELLWAAVRTAAENQALRGPGRSMALPKGDTPVRRWLASALAMGLERGVLRADEVLRLLPPSSWVGEVPEGVLADLIAMGLSQPLWNAELVLRPLAPRVIGENVAPDLTWAVLDAGAERAFNLTAPV